MSSSCTWRGPKLTITERNSIPAQVQLPTKPELEMRMLLMELLREATTPEVQAKATARLRQVTETAARVE